MKLRHINLLDHGDKRAVYDAMQEHFDRDTWFEMFWRAVFIASSFGAAWLLQSWPAFLAALSAFAFWKMARVGIDNINRNWTMHLIDWIERSDESIREPEGDEDDFWSEQS